MLTNVDSQLLVAVVGALAEIEDFKRQLNVVSDAELAAILGFPRSTIAQWKKRDAIPASAKQSIRAHIEYRGRNERAKFEFSKIPATKRHFAKALVIRYLVESTLEVDGDLEPDGLLFRAIEMDNFELAAARLLDRQLSAGARDLSIAFRNVLGAPDFVGELARELSHGTDT